MMALEERLPPEVLVRVLGAVADPHDILLSVATLNSTWHKLAHDNQVSLVRLCA